MGKTTYRGFEIKINRGAVKGGQFQGVYCTVERDDIAFRRERLIDLPERFLAFVLREDVVERETERLLLDARREIDAILDTEGTEFSSVRRAIETVEDDPSESEERRSQSRSP